MRMLAAVNGNQKGSSVVEVAYGLTQTHADELVSPHTISVGDGKEHMQAMRQVPGFDDVSVTRERERATAFTRTVVNNRSKMTLETLQPSAGLGHQGTKPSLSTTTNCIGTL